MAKKGLLLSCTCDAGELFSTRSRNVNIIQLNKCKCFDLSGRVKMPMFDSLNIAIRRLKGDVKK